ncbi:blue copper protein-like [Pyrus x bretschneideri]|uniref:blue copper protein-like n=1 Tax=Pyrus x bretschneideri TaxID=225117 RepID=UPI00203012BD|nr:blue copper protein-like [Pyrus x bretschneideri]
MARTVGLILVFAMVMMPSCLATVYTVGDSSGWDTGVDYSTWTSGKTFEVGDSLVFKYQSQHTVEEVTDSDYKTCTLQNSIKSHRGGTTTIPLKTAGTHNYICSSVGHCSMGMKLSVTVESGSTAAPSGGSDSNSTVTTPASTTKPSSTGNGSSHSSSLVVTLWSVISLVGFCMFLLI